MSYRVLCCAVLAVCFVQSSSFAADIIVPDNQPTVMAAVEAAAAGDVIRIRAGRYQGRLNITKGITLRSEGEGEVVICTAPENEGARLLIDSADPVTLEGLTFENIPSTEKVEDSAVVWIKRACVVRKCVFRAGADVGCSVRSCKAEDGSRPPANATFEDCSFVSNGTIGALVYDEAATADFTRCTFDRNTDAGLMLKKSSAGTATDCTAKENAGSGFIFWGTADNAGRITGCRAEKNSGCGILILNSKGATLTGNTCVENGTLGISVGLGSTVEAKDNICEKNRQQGICVLHRGSRLLAIGNRAIQNGNSGIEAAYAAELEARENVSDGNVQSGIEVGHWRTNGIIAGNTCRANKKQGITFTLSAGGVAEGNTCADNEEYGILVSDETTAPEIRENTLEGNKGGTTNTVPGLPVSRQRPFDNQCIGGALAHEDYDYLEEMAMRLRENRVCIDGHWLLDDYYWAVMGGFVDMCWRTEERYFAQLGKWAEAKPDSITPWVARAMSHRRWAWEIRGGDYANTVTPEGWKGFFEHLASAEGALREGEKRDTTKDPQFFGIWIEVASVNKGRDDKFIETLLRRAIPVEPEYWETYNKFTFFNTPRWKGQSGTEALEASMDFLYDEVKRVNPDSADKAYAKAFFFQEGDLYAGAGEGTAGNWERVEAGYLKLLQDFPDSVGLLNEFANVSTAFRKRERAADCFEKIQNRLDIGKWGDDKRYAGQARRWATDVTAPHPADIGDGKEKEVTKIKDATSNLLKYMAALGILLLVVGILGTAAIIVSRSGTKDSHVRQSPPPPPPPPIPPSFD